MNQFTCKCTECGITFVISGTDKDGAPIEENDLSWCPACESPLDVTPRPNAA